LRFDIRSGVLNFAALSDDFIRRTIQLKDLSSLKATIEKTMAIKVMQDNNFTQKQDDV